MQWLNVNEKLMLNKDVSYLKWKSKAFICSVHWYFLMVMSSLLFSYNSMYFLIFWRVTEESGFEKVWYTLNHFFITAVSIMSFSWGFLLLSSLLRILAMMKRHFERYYESQVLLHTHTPFTIVYYAFCNAYDNIFSGIQVFFFCFLQGISQQHLLCKYVCLFIFFLLWLL